MNFNLPVIFEEIMKDKPFAITLYALMGVLLLFIPNTSTDHAFNLFAIESYMEYFLLSVTLSTILIIIFYISYPFLLSTALRTKKSPLCFALGTSNDHLYNYFINKNKNRKTLLNLVAGVVIDV